MSCISRNICSTRTPPRSLSETTFSFFELIALSIIVNVDFSTVHRSGVTLPDATHLSKPQFASMMIFNSHLIQGQAVNMMPADLSIHHAHNRNANRSIFKREVFSCPSEK